MITHESIRRVVMFLTVLVFLSVFSGGVPTTTRAGLEDGGKYATIKGTIKTGAISGIVQDEDINGDAFIEEGPEGYCGGEYFPPDDGEEPPAGSSLPQPSQLATPGPLSQQSLANNFDLATWLLNAYQFLKNTSDPKILHLTGQKILSFQRGPLVNEVGLKFLEKASSQAPKEIWLANNYAVQQVALNNFSATSDVLFEEVRNRISKYGNAANSENYRKNLQTYKAAKERALTQISHEKRMAVENSNSTPESHLRLAFGYLLNNQLDEAWRYSNVSFDQPQLLVAKAVVQAEILKRKRMFREAAAALRLGIMIFEQSGQTDDERKRELTRMAGILDENAKAATIINRTVVDSGKPSPVDLSATIMQETCAPPGLCRLTIRSQQYILFPLTRPIRSVNFYGSRLFDSYNVYGTPGWFYYKTHYTADVYCLTGGPWQHCASHPRLVFSPLCGIVVHPASRPVRISWTFF